ncbi:conjugative transposon protein TraM [Flavitalea sp. BT771]|uniref:conjugative transposon protein TraM n=1 Tax=Flavitalea sp. BT771 TaxID=3063329 RepID=UPI0026E2971D|nr:conjugative transposon protein TraM [Flavitalea sp. BT771]MDO6433278.1 conjugative transposon protein TraM [Flavitalea sp. BT771]MDV6222817.1 conjugative transposon protein TraM [Flavitalea sp. BT771]
MTKQGKTKFEQRRKFLLVLPLFVIPFLFAMFYALGGGRGDKAQQPEHGSGMGFNMELPPAVFDKKEAAMDKMDYYKKADADSIRRRELMQQDPYRRHDKQMELVLPTRPAKDTVADGLMRRLDLLQKQMEQPAPVKRYVNAKRPTLVKHRQEALPVLNAARPDTTPPAVDPELEKLSEMLDKIARLQGVEETGKEHLESKPKEPPADKERQTIQAPVMAVPAVVERDQELVNGATIALRLTAGVVFNGLTIPNGQLVYGVVSLNNDRMQVNIHSIRYGQSILATTWQVYDMDGLMGIHIPEGLGRQVARQSADQSIGSLNLAAYDPSIGGQVTNAGIQAARSFFSRKVRALRVLVPAGYQVLLRDAKAGGSALRVLRDTTAGSLDDSMEVHAIVPPSVDSLEPFLHETVREGKVSVTLRGIYQREGVMWLYLVVRNRSAVNFSPDHLRCTIQQGKHIRRMAVQELPVQPLYSSLPVSVASGAEEVVMVGMKPFLLAKDKLFVLQMGERAGGRELLMNIHAQLILQSKQ